MTQANVVLYFFKTHFGAELSPIHEEFIMSTAKKQNFKKKSLIFMEGDANTRHYIIEKGLLRLYLIDSKGKEINILFAKENQVIGDLATPTATNFYLETIEDSVVYSYTEEQLQNILDFIAVDISMKPNNGIRRSYIHIQKRLVSILSKSAEENYLDFKKLNPDLIQRLPQYLIAGYLGISHEFLSKIIARTTKTK